jgi:hypothetical protein
MSGMRLRPRFSLRTLLIIVAVVAVLISIPVRRATEQRHAVNEILRLGGSVTYDFESTAAKEPSAPAWLRRTIGEDYFRSVDSVNLNGMPLADDQWALLTLLPTLEGLNLAHANVSDSGLIHLRDLPSLQVLNLEATQISDDGLKYLEALPALEQLSLGDTEISDAGLQTLESMPQLTVLTVENTPNISDGGLAHLSGLKDLIILRLHDEEHKRLSPITDAGVAKTHPGGRFPHRCVGAAS